MLDFTLDMYRGLLAALKKGGYEPVTVERYLQSQGQGRVAVMRHDVDRRPDTALQMAKIEHGLGVHSTYYFRYQPEVYDKAIIRKVADMGHEVGYHYEALDKADGDVKKAMAIFRSELASIREDFDVKTACMHGNPWKSWKNVSMFDGQVVSDFGLTGEAYASIDFAKVAYFTDTGRRWDRKYSVWDQVPANLASGDCIKGTHPLIQAIESGRYERLYLVVHPNRWNDFGYYWLKHLLFQNVKNVGKATLMDKGC